MDISHRERGSYVFGRFRLDPARRTLTRDTAPVPLTARLFDTLLYLVQHAERLVTRDELESAVWQGRAVEDGNLQKAVSALRKALNASEPGENFISTVTGHGFQFVMPVEFEPEAVAIGAFAALGARAGAAPSAPGGARRIRPVRVIASCFAIGTLLLAARSMQHHPQTTGTVFVPPPHSVAVLAFTNLSGDPGQEYFSDGVSEALIDALGNITALRVTARISSFSFKGKQVPIGDIARQLNVGSLLEGSVRRDGAKLRITAQLIDARSGYQIWSKHYDPDERDLLKVQDEIATAVATAMQVTMVGDDATKLSLGGTPNPKAFDAYLRGMIFHNEGTPDSVRQARIEFETALALDPNYALAHVRHVSCLILTAQGLAAGQPGDGSAAELLGRALTEAQQVARLAPNLGAAHTILGNALMMTGDFVGAGVEQARARALAPRDPWVNTMYGMYHALMGHAAEASGAAQLAADLDPLSSEAYFNLAQVLSDARRPADALAALQRAKQLGALNTDNAYVTYMSELEEGDGQAALRACSAGEGKPFCLALAYHLLGRQSDADAQLKKLRDGSGDGGALDYARIYAQWGRTDEALHWLERADAEHAVGMQEIRAMWIYDPIRNTERFKTIERKMNFPP